MGTSTSLSPLLRFMIAFALVAAGAIGVLATFDIGPLHVRDINGPRWLGVAVGGIFLAGGVFVCTGDVAVRYSWIGSACGVLIFSGLAAIANWIAFGAGPRECTGAVAGFAAGFWQAGDIECRAAFGFGALLMDGMLVWGLGASLRRSGSYATLASWIEKLGKGMLVLALAPILLLLFVTAIGKGLLHSFAAYRRTGKWPRHEEFIAGRNKAAP